MRLVLYIILLVGLANSIIIDKALGVFTPKELKRRAKSGHDKKSAAIYKMAAYGRSLSVLLWLKGVICAGILLILLGGTSWFVALVFVLAVGWSIKIWQPPKTNDTWVWWWAAKVAPAIAFIMSYLSPLLGGGRHKGTPTPRSGVYEKEDLLEFLHDQNNQADNRISESELKMAFNALTFGDKKVGEVMTPLRQVKLVADTETIGPMLTDELYKTGFSRFPVVREGTTRAANPQVIGTLYLKELIGYEGKSLVRELMDRKVFYINEVQSLRDALGAFIKTHHHMFIVVNNFEEVVGVLTIEDVLEQILGEKIVDEFDHYDDLRAVAGLEAKKDHADHAHVKTSEQTTETVVE
ncbi:MAG TPA: CBS domain-containing protein [Candidatus Binatia bacterium]|nr:CBS domain-containing protein [Candidatus Binatia bacterium]